MSRYLTYRFACRRAAWRFMHACDVRGAGVGYPEPAPGGFTVAVDPATANDPGAIAGLATEHGLREDVEAANERPPSLPALGGRPWAGRGGSYMVFFDSHGAAHVACCPGEPGAGCLGPWPGVSRRLTREELRARGLDAPDMSPWACAKASGRIVRVDGWEILAEHDTLAAGVAFDLRVLEERGGEARVSDDVASYWVPQDALCERIDASLSGEALAQRYGEWCRDWGASEEAPAGDAA